MKKFVIYFLFLLFGIMANGQTVVPYNQKEISYMGRIDSINKNHINIYWPGTSASITFIGTEAKAILKNGNEDAYFFVIVDGDFNNPHKIKPDTLKSSCPLVSGLPKGKHTIQLFKLSNNTSVTSFYGFELNEGAKIIKPQCLGKRKIEFYGNSITAGHGVDVAEGNPDSGEPEYFNNYWTYAARTARHYNAQYSCISRSGIGVMVSWFPIIMPEMYDRLNPSEPDSKWDFSAYTPNIVVINLGQNDKWLTQRFDHDQFKARFGETPPTEQEIVTAYKNFVTKIRSKYPAASIICALGSMDATMEGSLWPGYVQQAVAELNDKNIFTHFFKFKNSPGHPIASEQKAMADDLINFIDKTIKW